MHKGATNAQTSPASDAQSVPVLLYHGVITSSADGVSVTIDNFIDQMLALKNAGYQTISMQQYYDYIMNGTPVPERSFLLTFDDGRKDSYYPVKPLLEALGYKATMFVITGMSYPKSNSFYLSPRELTTMMQSGNWDIQPHTKDGHTLYPTGKDTKGHFYTNKLWLSDQNRLETEQEFTERVRRDLQGAKDDVTNNLGVKALAFAFPYGEIGENQTNFSDSREMLLDQVKAVYPMAFFQFYPARGYSQNYQASKDFLNKRIDVLPMWNATDLVDKLQESSAKPLPFTASPPKETDGWLSTWAGKTFTDQGLVLQATTDSRGAAVHLDGSYMWQNYTTDSTIRLTKGNAARALFYLADADTYVACSYSTDGVQLQQVIDGKLQTLSKRVTPISFADDLQIATAINGTAASCSVPGGEPITGTTTVTQANRGGIGYVVSSENVGDAEGILKRVSVNPLN